MAVAASNLAAESSWLTIHRSTLRVELGPATAGPQKLGSASAGSLLFRPSYSQQKP